MITVFCLNQSVNNTCSFCSKSSIGKFLDEILSSKPSQVAASLGSSILAILLRSNGKVSVSFHFLKHLLFLLSNFLFCGVIQDQCDEHEMGCSHSGNTIEFVGNFIGNIRRTAGQVRTVNSTYLWIFNIGG